MKLKNSFKKLIVYMLLILIFFVPNVSAQVTNGFFNTSIDEWSTITSGVGGLIEWDDFDGYGGPPTPGCANSRVSLTDGTYEGTAKIYQNIDVTDYGKIGFYANTLMPAGDGYGGYITGNVGSNNVSVGNTGNIWQYFTMDIIGTDVQEFNVDVYKWNTPGHPGTTWLRLDNVELLNQYRFILSGYVTDKTNTPIQYATISLSDSAGEDVTNATGYYEILHVENGTYTMSAVASDYERYSGAVVISGDTTQNISMTLSTDAPDVWIPLPIYPPTPTPTDIPDDNETTIIEEIIEPIKNIIDEIIEPILELLPEELVEIIEETITYVSTPFNWLLLITAYIGAFIGKSIFNNDEDYAEIITNTLLLGTIGWIVVLLINFVVPIISQNEIISILIFTTSGFIIAAIASSIQPETKTRAPRRPHR